ncbi:hypothetical protein CK203_037782 [Vitis vinifera]|uniref:Uncharacterized protein n=1 Tax=Vitis vinifera TaxID=29760 RepID=A0A438IHF2_VITVI|nr:hypothetical protein CK203_037782 [Vitis vinifera]
MELDVERRPSGSKEGQISGVLKDPLEVDRTMSVLEGPALVGRSSAKALNGARAHRGLPDIDCGKPDGDDFGFQMGSSPPAPNHAKIIDEALMEEASKYIGRDGVIVITDGGSEWGCVSEAVGVAVLGPLRVILADRREAEVSGLSGKANGAIEEVIRGYFRKGYTRGMLMEGFEGEILILLKIMRERKLQKGKLDGGGEGGWGVVVASLDEDSFAFMECKRS